MPKIVGIDLGTSNSCMAIMRVGTATIIPPSGDATRRVTASVVSLPQGWPKTKPFAGAIARARAQENAQFTFFGTKRLLGRKYDDPLVQSMLGFSPFDIAPGSNGEAMLVGRDGQLISPERILSEVIASMKKDGEDFLGEPVSHCILTVPAHFDTFQVESAVEAVKLAGITVVKTMLEPAAAALAYGFSKQIGRTIAVYDFGGGTFDISILRVKKGGFDLVASAGDPFLGGQDFDMRLVQTLLQRLEDKTGLDARHNPNSLQRLYDAVEVAKEALSTQLEHTIVLQNLSDAGLIKMATLSETITREELEELTRDLVERTIDPCEEALRRARLDPGDIDDVVLVGGMTMMPLVRRTVEEIFGRPGLTDLPYDIAVATGAALMGAAEMGTIKGVSINEKLSHSIGFADSEGNFVRLLAANKPLDRENAIIVTTAEDNQTDLWVAFYEGEREDVTANRFLHRLLLRNIEPMEAGLAQIRIAGRVDRDGVLTVHVADKNNPSNEVIRQMHTGSGMTKEELDELRQMSAAA